MPIIVGYLAKKATGESQRKMWKIIGSYWVLCYDFLIKQNEGAGKHVIWYSKNESGKSFRNRWL